ncbi:MAG: VOC family protein, partial [Chloroflexota bacterium]
VARQTDQLDAVKRFYCGGLGLPVLSEFVGHAGYDGLIVGLPGRDYHLEFVQHEDGSPGAAPGKENLLVFYIRDESAVQSLAQKLVDMSYVRVPAENPWWERHHAITIEDPDGWRIVLQPEPEN